jgi:hypothetical protein
MRSGKREKAAWHGRQSFDLITAPLIERCNQAKDILQAAEYNIEILEDFLEPFQNAVQGEDAEGLLEMFCLEHISDAIVCLLRILTAAILKRVCEEI